MVQWLRLCLPMQGVWACSLVGELKSYMLHSKKQPTKQNIKQKQYYNKFNKDKVLQFKKKSLKKAAENTSDEAGRGRGNETRSRGLE